MKHLPKIKCLVLHPQDNIGILATSGGKPGEGVEVSGSLEKVIRLKNVVPAGHKIAIRKIKYKEPILKFNQIIGLSQKNILPGEHVHIHNMKFTDKIRFSQKIYKNKARINFKKDRLLPTSFNGFLRRDGRAGIRNYIIVLSTVNCSATVAKSVANYFGDKDISRFGINGIIPVTHASGCAQAIGGYAYNLLNRTIAGWLDHPNVVGAAVIGLGCEGTTLRSLKNYLGPRSKLDCNYLECFNIQEVGGTKNAVELGIKKVKRILSHLPRLKRIKLPVSLLNVALNCGGSDVLSGLTANPALGIAGDILVSYGGTVVLGEVPECFGTEKMLFKRSVSERERLKLTRIFSWWDNYAKKNHISMDNNLSPGNMAGGISTILEKSLGAIAKGGTSPINQVVNYAERITKQGLVFMDTPGFDPVSVTGMVAGGCNLVAFTTGRGSVYGCSIAPTIKIASNSEIYNKLRGDIDIDAGKVLTRSTLAEAGQEIYSFFINVANGEKTLSEKQGLGREEFVPWTPGETL